MFKLVLVLSLCYIAAECGHIKRNGGCDSVLACDRHRVGTDIFNTITNNATYGEFCQKATAFKSCYNGAEKKCDNQELKDNLTAEVNVADFVCSEISKKDFFTVANSECVKNELKVVELELAIDGCTKDSQQKLKFSLENITPGQDASSFNFCPFVNELFVCELKKHTDMCGKRVGGFLDGLLKASTRPSFEQFSCGN
ncbi:uncharacterized protein LOC131950263 [Physella acuta]|uniref:uncharacterized protein LOC131950263 n=1 Tax=Physella acuta TaxID=109671 RepID=UPI0027DC27E9|nr:uncharacterized protein LOC131950263 [Physella acuta]